MSHRFHQICESLIGELNLRRHESERGNMNWLQIRITLNRGAPKVTCQFEEECPVDEKANGAMKKIGYERNAR
jgi:hypothetical protein